jgi:ADP-ribosylglycohydrolase
MLGAIAGDVVGSVFEFSPVRSTDFPLFVPHSTFTDDSVLTVAVAETILEDGDFAANIFQYGNHYTGRGYGGRFRRWLDGDLTGPYNSFGNGSAMRVSPVGHAWDTVEEVLKHAERSAAVTHNHPEGIKGAQAVALAILLARQGADKKKIRSEIKLRFGYHLDRTVDEIRPGYRFNETCQGSVPESIICFLEGEDFEETVRLAISLGGDADTMACIAGSIAEPFYGEVPPHIAQEARARLEPSLLQVLDRFRERFPEGR